MSRPTVLIKDTTLYWVLPLYNTTGALVDADSTPTVTVRRQGSPVADSVTVTKRSATTGLYDCSYTPTNVFEGEQITIEETVVISSTTYKNAFSVTVLTVERGTDSAALAETLNLVKTKTDQMVFSVANQIDANSLTGSATASEIWSAPERTLTYPIAAIPSSQDGTEWTMYRGTTWSIPISGLGSIAGWTKIYFSVRDKKLDKQSSTAISAKVENPGSGTDGLVLLNGSAPSDATWASIAVTDATAGNLTITVKPNATTLVSPQIAFYDIKVVFASSVQMKSAGGTINIRPDVTRAIS